MEGIIGASNYSDRKMERRLTAARIYNLNTD